MSQLLDDILAGRHDDMLRDIKEITRKREKALAAMVHGTLKVGDSVQFNENTNPKYMIGALATVTKILPKNIDVEMAETVGRFEVGFPVRTSVELVDLVESIDA